MRVITSYAMGKVRGSKMVIKASRIAYRACKTAVILGVWVFILMQLMGCGTYNGMVRSISIGATQDEVIDKIGKPDEKYTYVVEGKSYEQWWYGDHIANVTFKDGIVTSIFTSGD